VWEDDAEIPEIAVRPVTSPRRPFEQQQAQVPLPSLDPFGIQIAIVGSTVRVTIPDPNASVQIPARFKSWH